jgi:hypothetical protein
MREEKNEPVLDDVAFDNVFGRWAMELDPFCEGAPVGVMATLMAAFSAYIGPGVRAKTRIGSSPLSAWFVLVGASGEGRKGWTLRIARPVITKALKAWHEKGILESCPATGLGLMKSLAEREGGSVVAFEQEMDDFIRNARNDSRIGVYLRKVWDGDGIVHKTSKDFVEVSDPHMALVGHVQPDNWGAIAGSRDATGGTYNRFVPLHVKRSKDLDLYYGPSPDDVQEEIAREFRETASLVREMGSQITAPQDVAKRFKDYYRPAAEDLIRGNTRLAQMAERPDGKLIRLASLYAIADLREEIAEKDFESALALIRYSVETIRHVLPDMGGESLANQILNALLNGPITLTDLRDYIGKNVKREEIDRTLNMLPQVKRYQRDSTGGRRPTYLELVQPAGDSEGVPA